MARYRIAPDRSELWAEARSSLHPINVHTSGFQGEVSVEEADGRRALALPTQLEIETGRLKSGHALIDHELERKLDARKFPRIRGTVREASAPEGGRQRLRGELTLHGVTVPLDGDVTVRALDEDTIEVAGERVIDMRDFGLQPPRFLMLKVHPDVRIRARVIARREG